MGQVLLSYAKEVAKGDYFLSKGICLKKIGYIAKELNDFRDKIKRGRSSILLPVAEGILINTKLLSQFFLKEL